MQDKLKRLVDSLTLKRMDARLHNIATALPKTCTWHIRQTTFKNWIDDQESQEHEGFLWIKGKPGCGKSTIIKGALNWTNKNSCKTSWITVSYFFNARTIRDLEKSTLGLYRSLVHLLLEAVPSFAATFEDMFSWKVLSELDQ